MPFFAMTHNLDYKGARVEAGDAIKANDVDSISRMICFTTKPHLHIVVHKARNISIPVYFNGIGRK